jgi:tRNA threonylcarbamoyladenosine biosynthesis protein TsaE
VGGEDKAANTLFIKSLNESDTLRIGEFIGERAFPGFFIALKGDLGAGKTVFVKGMAKGLGILDMVTSPTFVTMNVYEGRLALYHFDLYRTGCYGDEELEYFEGEGVSAVEWPVEPLPRHRMEAEITGAGDKRSIKLSAYGERYEVILREAGEIW